MDEKKIRFSGQEDITPLMKRLRQESEQLGRDLIRDARAYTTSGREALKYIEEQIRAIERRGKADRESRISELDVARQKGGIGEQTYKSRVAGITAESTADKQQVLLLRELIDTIKNEARREIIEDRRNVERQIRGDKSLDRLGIKGDELLGLKRTIQRAEIGDIKEKEVSEKEKFQYGKVLQNTSNVAGTIAGSRNQFYAVAAGLAMIPIIGQGVSTLATKALSSAEGYQEGLGGMSQLSGLSQHNYYGAGGDLTNIGYTKADFLRLQRRSAIAGGGVPSSKQAARDIAFLERGTGVSADLFLQQEMATRAGGGGAMAGTRGLIAGLQGVGAIKGQDLSLLGEYLPILVNLQREQVAISGKTNDKIANDLIASIAGLDESFNNPEILKTLIPNLRSDVKNAGTPQAQAFKFSVISGMKQHQGKSYTELQEIMENAGPEELEAIRQEIINRFGTGEAGIQAAKGLLPSTFGGRTALAKTYIQKGQTPPKGKVVDIDFERRAGTDYGTGDLRAGTAKFTEKFETVGQALTDAIQDLVGANKEVKEGFSELNKTIQSAFNGDQSAIAALITSNNDLSKVIGRIAEFRYYGVSSW